MNFLKNESGAVVVEYAMIIGLIALFSFAAWKMLGRVLGLVVRRLLFAILW